MHNKFFYYLTSIVVFNFFISCNDKSKISESIVTEPSSHVIKHNDSIRNNMPHDKKDFQRALFGYIGSIKEKAILEKTGQEIFDIKKYNFVLKNSSCPTSVNPILWRQSQLNSIHGLFKITEGIYQVRGYDLANMTLIEGQTGWIVVDPLLSEDTSRAALQLADKYLGKKPVKAIIITHSHIDHFGGVKGVFEKNKLAQIIVPQHFFEEAISENVLGGYLMGRRSQFMYGTSLSYNEKENIGIGLGQSISYGKTSIPTPTYEVKKDEEKLLIDGVEFEFELTPGAEAPSEFMFYLPKFKAFCHAEEMTQGMHNLYTLRGAKIRDGLQWSNYLNAALKRYGNKTQVSFGSHHWPIWGKEEVTKFYENQRDLYKYIHDQTLNYANKGYKPLEIAEKLKLPKSLDTLYYNKGIYGSLNHNIKAQYQLYFGWFDGHLSNLHKLTMNQESKKMIEYMGGEQEIMDKAKKDYQNGEYRFVATVLSYLVQNNPKNKEARKLLAMTYRQMGYMAESGPWRNFYLTGAKELMEGNLPFVGPKARNKELVMDMPINKILDAMGVALNGEKAWGERLTINFNFINPKSNNLIFINNGVLHYELNKNSANADFSVNMDKQTFAKIALEETSYAKEIALGNIKIKGNVLKLLTFSKLIDKFHFEFPMILPLE